MHGDKGKVTAVRDVVTGRHTAIRMIAGEDVRTGDYLQLNYFDYKVYKVITSFGGVRFRARQDYCAGDEITVPLDEKGITSE